MGSVGLAPMRLYLDTNVFIAYVRSEMDRAFNLRFQEAGDFFNWCQKQNAILVISAYFLQEVEKLIGMKPIAVKETFQFLGLSCEYGSDVEYSAMQNVRVITGIHAADAWHVANALHYRCDCIITFNLKDFEKAEKIIPCSSPRDRVYG